MKIVNTKNWYQDKNGEWWYSSPSWKKKGFKTKGKLYKCKRCGNYSPKIPTRSAVQKGEVYCSRKCSSRAKAGHLRKRGKDHPAWTGGRNKIRGGYIEIYAPDHPYARGGKYVREHRLVMEEKLGRYLHPWEKIHHINGIKDDNRIENLELWTTRHLDGVRKKDWKVRCPKCNDTIKYEEFLKMLKI